MFKDKAQRCRSNLTITCSTAGKLASNACDRTIEHCENQLLARLCIYMYAAGNAGQRLQPSSHGPGTHLASSFSEPAAKTQLMSPSQPSLLVVAPHCLSRCIRPCGAAGEAGLTDDT